MGGGACDYKPVSYPWAFLEQAVTSIRDGYEAWPLRMVLPCSAFGLYTNLCFPGDLWLIGGTRQELEVVPT